MFSGKAASAMARTRNELKWRVATVTDVGVSPTSGIASSEPSSWRKKPMANMPSGMVTGIVTVIGRPHRPRRSRR